MVIRGGVGRLLAKLGRSATSGSRSVSGSPFESSSTMPPTARRVILISGHYLRSRRRAGFHHLAEAYRRAGWDVTLLTAAISLLSRLRGDYRFEYPVLAEANRLIPIDEQLTSFVLMTRTHPGNLRFGLANRLSTPWFARYARLALGPLEESLRRADLVIFEG